ncbi:hypothetical protein X801_03454, partial [Opisthorchis viverrini]
MDFEFPYNDGYQEGPLKQCEESVSSASKLYVPCVPSLVPETPAPLTHGQIAMAMFGYMTTNYDSVEMLEPYETEAKGEDSLSLLYHFLDEWLFAFSAEPYFIPRVICITEFDMENFRIKSVGWGEPFQLGKHPQVIDPHSLLVKPITFFQGTEVKAITYSNMQIHDKEDQH